MQETLDLSTTWYVDADDSLNLDKLMEAFQDFFRRHSEHWKNRFEYEEAWPQILLQAYLHRVVNGAVASSGSTAWAGGGWTCCLSGRRACPGGIGGRAGAGVRGGVQGGARRGWVGEHGS